MNKTLRTLVPALAVMCAACAQPGERVAVVAFSGATVWDGTGAAPIADATLYVHDGRVHSVEAGDAVPDDVEVVEEVDVSGSYIIPGLINSHGHVSGLWAGEDVTDELERVRGDLELFGRYGVTTVNSLGDTEVVIRARNEATPTDARARLLAAGPVIADSDPAAARATAEANADAGVDWLKLRVDDNLGTGEKMPWEAVEAVLAVGRERGIPVATHLFYLDDAKRLLEMGTGMIAHSVRDASVDADFLEQLRTSGVCYVPTLTREVSTFVYAERPDFFDDAFFTRHANPGQVERVSDPAFMTRMAESPAAAGYRVALEQAEENLKTIADADLPVAMGTDAGPAGRFPGYFEHLELWMMVDAGLTPAQALLSATSVAASCLGRADLGALTPGAWADFLVLDGDPLANIRSTASLDRVYIAGRPVR
jgi:imidazolonepropionase-like amidohydrolase